MKKKKEKNKASYDGDFKIPSPFPPRTYPANGTKEFWVSITSYITHGLMINQVMEKEYELNCCKKMFPGLTKKVFDRILVLMHQSGSITGISKTHIYQTSSTLKKQKTFEEIFAIVGR
jgi:hypothetical protein